MAVLVQRPLKGSRISSFYPVKSLPPLSALDSAFQLQEYISLLIRLDVHDVDRIVTIPGKGSDAQEGGDAKGEEKDAEKDGAGSVNVDEACWVYEQLRRLAQDLSHPLITMLQQECTRSTCPEMKAGEWLYLCVAHGNEGAMEQCCAIDYILHTLDSATALLNSPRAFPSRLSVPPTSHRHFSSLARRLGRIFAHAYFHHREAFEQAEAESSLYARFLALTSKFDLVPAEFLVIPPRLTAMSDDDRGGRGDHVEPPRLLAASLDPRRDLGHDDGRWPGQNGQGRDRGTSPPGSVEQQRTESPRKFGRNRTDTMVYSEAFSVAEELAKGDLSEVDIDREIAAERAAAAVEEDLPAAAPPPATDNAERHFSPIIVPINDEPKPEPSEPQQEQEPEPESLSQETQEEAEELGTPAPAASDSDEEDEEDDEVDEDDEDEENEEHPVEPPATEAEPPAAGSIENEDNTAASSTEVDDTAPIEENTVEETSTAPASETLEPSEAVEQPKEAEPSGEKDIPADVPSDIPSDVSEKDVSESAASTEDSAPEAEMVEAEGDAAQPDTKEEVDAKEKEEEDSSTELQVASKTEDS